VVDAAVAGPEEDTAIEVQEAGPYVIWIEHSGTPKESIETLSAELTTEATETLREGVKTTVVV